jgi:hypothetical protein
MIEGNTNPDQAALLGQSGAGALDASGGTPPTLDGATAAGALPLTTAPGLDALQTAPVPDAPEVTRTEIPRTPDTREMMDANTVIIRSLALQESKRQPPATNEAQKSLAYLGSILAQPKGKDLQAHLRRADGKPGGFRDTEGLPRVMEITKPDGKTQLVSAYDRRASDMDTEPTTKAKGEYDLSTFTGRGEDGQLGFICQGEEDDDIRNFQFHDGEFIQVYLVAQKDQIAKGLEDAENGTTPFTRPSPLDNPDVLRVLAIQIGNADVFVGKMAQLRAKDPAADVDLAKGITPEQMVTALEKTGVDPVSVRKFADGVKHYISTDSWGGNPAERDRLNKEIDEIAMRLDQGLVPTSKDISRLIIIGSNPHLEKQKATLQTRIDNIQGKIGSANTESIRGQLQADLDVAKKSLAGIEAFQAGDPTAEYNVYIQALTDGEVDTEDTAWFTNKLKAVTNPWAILKDHDISDPDCLAGKAFAHLTHEMNDEQKERIKAWLSKFLQEHGSDIAMMGIFALFQMMTGIIGDAVQKA